MERKRLSAEQIVTKLRQIEVLQAQGKTIAVGCNEARTTGQSYYRGRKEYCGLGIDQANRLKQLETKNETYNRDADRCARARSVCHKTIGRINIFKEISERCVLKLIKKDLISKV
jgi:putative transposase